MDKRKNSIQEHQIAVDQLDLDRDRQIEELGKLLSGRKKWTIDELRESYNKVKTLEEEVSTLQKNQESIRENLEKQRELKEQIEDVEEREKSYGPRRKELIGSIGAHAYRVHRNGNLDGEGFNTIFSPIEKIAEEIRTKENRVKDLEEELKTKNLVQKVSNNAKITLHKTAIARLEKKRENELPKLGRELVDTGKVEDIPDEQVRSATSALKQHETEQEERQASKEGLQGELQKLQDVLNQLTGGDSAEKLMKRNETELTTLREKLLQHQLLLGKAYLLQPAVESEIPKETQTVLKRIEELDQQKRLHEDRIHNLQSLIEIDDLQEEVKKKEEQIARLEKRIAEDREKVEKTRDELIVDKDRIQELSKVTVEVGDEKE